MPCRWRPEPGNEESAYSTAGTPAERTRPRHGAPRENRVLGPCSAPARPAILWMGATLSVAKVDATATWPERCTPIPASPAAQLFAPGPVPMPIGYAVTPTRRSIRPPARPRRCARTVLYRHPHPTGPTNEAPPPSAHRASAAVSARSGQAKRVACLSTCAGVAGRVFPGLLGLQVGTENLVEGATDAFGVPRRALRDRRLRLRLPDEVRHVHAELALSERGAGRNPVPGPGRSRRGRWS